MSVLSAAPFELRVYGVVTLSVQTGSVFKMSIELYDNYFKEGKTIVTVKDVARVPVQIEP